MLWSPKLLLQVRSNCLITYFQNNYHISLTEEQKLRIIEAIKLSRLNRYQGMLTVGARKRLSRAVDLLVQCIKPKTLYNEVSQRYIKHKLSFITLTIPDNKRITGQECYEKVFVHFIQWMRRTKKATTYIWKLEVQERGQLHYHITTPTWIHYQEIRDKWNNLLRQNNLMDDFKAKYGHEDPNSTDIHEVRHVDDLSNYLKKEFCKSIQNPNTKGKVWDCSYNLKSSKYYSVEYDSVMLNHLIKMKYAGLIFEKELEQCSIIENGERQLDQFLTLQQLMEYDLWKIAVSERLN